MNRILILDTETTSLSSATGHLVEVACAVWSVEHKSLLRAYSSVVSAPQNEAESINGIPSAMVSGTSVRPRADVIRALQIMSDGCDLILAHGADFDSQWLPELVHLPWVCSCNDIEWPRPSTSRSLTALALAHGLGVSHAHRALADVMTLVRLLERAHELGADIEAMLARGLRPKATYVAVVSFEEKDTAKSHGFGWDPASKQWRRKMACEDAKKLPFKVRRID